MTKRQRRGVSARRQQHTQAGKRRRRLGSGLPIALAVVAAPIAVAQATPAGHVTEYPAASVQSGSSIHAPASAPAAAVPAATPVALKQLGYRPSVVSLAGLGGFRLATNASSGVSAAP